MHARACARARMRSYQAATGGQPERMVSGSDDLTMFMWHPSASKQPVARMSGHQQLINQVCFCVVGPFTPGVNTRGAQQAARRAYVWPPAAGQPGVYVCVRP
eukprot:364431-Chlamydomonas_euryale.AAC.5